MRMLVQVAIAAIALAAPTDYQAAKAAALADYGTFSKIDAPYIRYLDWTTRPELSTSDVEAIHAFWIPHQSRQQILERQIPVPIRVAGKPCGMWRIDLRDLKWDLQSWYQLAKEYPYAGGYPNPLIVRGDWLLWITGDGTQSQLHYHLLYGFNKGPKNRDEFMRFWGVDLKASDGLDHATLIDADQSGVAFETRTVVERRTVAGYSWETLDSLEGFGRNDPLGQLENGLKKFAYDAGEIINSMRKEELRKGRTWYAQAMLLTDGKGTRVEEANARIVEDKSGRVPVIRNPGRCYVCHTTGILSLPKSLVRGMAQRGSETYHYSKDDAIEFERKFLAELGTIVDRAQEDFCGWLPSYTKLSTAEVVALYARTIDAFEAKVTIEQAAIELRLTVAEFKQRSNLYASRAGRLPPRYSQLIADGEDAETAIPRKIWQYDVFPLAYKISLGLAP